MNIMMGTYEGKEKCILTQEDKMKIKKLGLAKNKKSSIEETLEILEKLSEEGIKITKQQCRKSEEGKNRYTFLHEIEAENIEEIITKLGLDKNYPIGSKILNMISTYKGYGTNKITEEDKKRIEATSLLTELDKKVAQQNALKQKQEEVEKLKSRVKSQLDKDNTIGGKDEQ